MYKKYIIEFIGTFFLVLTVAISGNPLAVGAVLIALLYMGAYISGAHYNPAVTLALLIANKISGQIARQYMIVQMLGGIAAAVVFLQIQKSIFIPRMGANVSFSSALLVEILFTFLLASVVLHTAATKRTQNNNYFGLAIGLTVLAGAYVAGPISGGVFNPAVGAGPLLFDVNNLANHLPALLLYTCGPGIGAILAGYLYSYLDK